MGSVVDNTITIIGDKEYLEILCDMYNDEEFESEDIFEEFTNFKQMNSDYFGYCYSDDLMTKSMFCAGIWFDFESIYKQEEQGAVYLSGWGESKNAEPSGYFAILMRNARGKIDKIVIDTTCEDTDVPWGAIVTLTWNKNKRDIEINVDEYELERRCDHCDERHKTVDYRECCENWLCEECHNDYYDCEDEDI